AHVGEQRGRWRDDLVAFDLQYSLEKIHEYVGCALMLDEPLGFCPHARRVSESARIGSGEKLVIRHGAPQKVGKTIRPLVAIQGEAPARYSAALFHSVEKVGGLQERFKH